MNSGNAGFFDLQGDLTYFFLRAYQKNRFFGLAKVRMKIIAKTA
jgi:hypothetical protein